MTEIKDELFPFTYHTEVNFHKHFRFEFTNGLFSTEIPLLQVFFLQAGVW